MTASKALRGGWLESGQRIRFWPVLTPRCDLRGFIVPTPPEGFVIQHAGTTYDSLAAAEQAAIDSYRVITYGPIGQKESP